jgi:hypothetical protein
MARLCLALGTIQKFFGRLAQVGTWLYYFEEMKKGGEKRKGNSLLNTSPRLNAYRWEVPVGIVQGCCFSRQPAANG